MIMSQKILQSFPEWAQWLHENLARNCEPAALANTLLENGFSQESISNAVALFGKVPLKQHPPLQALPLDSQFHQMMNPFITQEDNGYLVSRINTKKLQIYTIDNFLSPQECESVIRLGELRLRPSTVTINNGDDAYRTSNSADLGLIEIPFMRQIDEKICHALGVSSGYGEVTQLQKYEVGQEFKNHTDYFEPNSGEYQNHAAHLGNRTWTFMVYLNTVAKGGGTCFPALNHSFTPKQGQAVVWNSCNHDGTVNPNTLHAGLPVESGVKYVITKWFRQRSSTG